MKTPPEEPNAVTTVAELPELVTFGKRTVSLKGWDVKLVRRHLEDHLKLGGLKAWCAVGCMASTMFQRKSPENIRKVRRRMSDVFKTLLMDSGLFVTIEYASGKGTHGEIMAMKVYEGGESGAAELESASRQLKRMNDKKELTSEVWERALDVIHRK